MGKSDSTSVSQPVFVDLYLHGCSPRRALWRPYTLT